MLREVKRYWAAGIAEKIALVALSVSVAVFTCVGLFAVDSVLTGSLPSSGALAQATNTAGPHRTPTVESTAALQAVHFPPTTQADLRGLATNGSASAIHVASSENVGLGGACPQPRREVWVDPGVTGQQLAEDLLSFFYSQGLESPCGSLVVAYNSQSEAEKGDYYTAGRVNLDVYNSNGQYNLDPNATNLKYMVTLDVGGVLARQEYIVTY
jgi:hypothetical protein